MSIPSSRRLYRYTLSGHSHRVKLFLSLLGLEAEFVEVNLRQREQKLAEFLAKNPLGQVPVLEDGEVTLSDSNAILMYLAAQYGGKAWMPESALALAHTVRWFQVASGPVTQSLALLRAHHLFGAKADLAVAQDKAHELLAVYERALVPSAFLLGNKPGLSDIASYTYVAHAPEGGIPLEEYPNVVAWLRRIESLPGFVGMAKSPRP